MNPIVTKWQIVFDKEQSEYVNFQKWSCERGRAVVFNPRCGETYETDVRALTVKEIGNYAER